MSKKIKSNLFKILLAAAILVPSALIANHVLAATVSNNDTNICTPNPGGTNNLSSCINSIYTLAIALSGFLAVIMFVYAGYMYMSGGSENISKAKSIFGSTIASLIILFGVYALLNTINPQLTNINGIILPKVQCGGQVNCAAPTPVLPGGAGGGGGTASGGARFTPIACTNCIDIFQKQPPLTVKNSPTFVTQHAFNILATVAGSLGSKGITFTVTAGAETGHISKCHSDPTSALVGGCFDVVVNSPTPQNWAALCTAFKQAGATSFLNEAGSDAVTTGACGAYTTSDSTGANVHVNAF